VTGTSHHDYVPGTPVLVLIDGVSGARWHAATFLGTRVGVQLYNATFLVVQTRDDRVWDQCCPSCVRPALPGAAHRDNILHSTERST
jgi:hypothetical protein